MNVQWNSSGLAPCIVQDVATGQVLMLAWMNEESLAKTQESGYVHFYSRSRQKLWKKGETSGNTLSLHDLRVDCDNDTIYASVSIPGPACHTGRTTCFFQSADGSTDDESGPPAGILGLLELILAERRDGAANEKSYTQTLFRKGHTAIAAKIVEEAGELVDELEGGSPERLVSEAADLVFHIMVALSHRQIPVSRVFRELARRFGKSGLEEKASR